MQFVPIEHMALGAVKTRIKKIGAGLDGNIHEVPSTEPLRELLMSLEKVLDDADDNDVFGREGWRWILLEE